MTIGEIDPSSWVRLNVGGKKFVTTVGTLTQREPESMLAAMFSGCHTLEQEQKGYVLIDRDGDYFGDVLNWLRYGEVPTLDAREHYHLLKEAEYYQLLGLIDRINSMNTSAADLTRLDVIKCIQSDKKKFRGVNLDGLDLSNLDLGGISFSHACLTNVSFRGANLTGCCFENADARGAIFSNSILDESSFRGARLDGANFADASITDSKFYDADARGAIFFNSVLKRSGFTRAKLDGANFTGANLERANFDRATLSRADFTEANLG